MLDGKFLKVGAVVTRRPTEPFGGRGQVHSDEPFMEHSSGPDVSLNCSGCGGSPLPCLTPPDDLLDEIENRCHQQRRRDNTDEYRPVGRPVPNVAHGQFNGAERGRANERDDRDDRERSVR